MAKGGGDVSKGEHDVDSTGDRCGCSRILMGTVMEGDVKAAGGFPLEAEEDVAAVEKDVGAAVGGPKSAKEDLGLKRNAENGENAEEDAESLIAWRSWRLGGLYSSLQCR